MTPERIIRSGDSPHDTDPYSPALHLVDEAIRRERSNGAVEIHNGRDQKEVTRALRDQVKKATEWEFREPCDRLNVWADRVKGRFFDQIIRPDRPFLPDPVIGIATLDNKRTLAQYSLVPNAQGLLYEITLNQVHFEEVEGHMVWKYMGEYGMIETLTHEMIHLWQQNGGGKEPYKTGSNTHNKEFILKAASIGLHVAPVKGYHLAPADGDFERFMKEYGISKPQMPDVEFAGDMDWWKFLIDILGGKEVKGRSSLMKYTCDCGQNVRVGRKDWPGAECNSCHSQYHRADLSQTVTIYERKKGPI